MPIRAFRVMSKAMLGPVLLATGLACGDPYQHPNPSDPAVGVRSGRRPPWPRSLYGRSRNNRYACVYGDGSPDWFTPTLE